MTNRNSEGKYHCPVTFKVFNENTHITAVKTTGNVFSHEAIETLNIKTKNWKDLLDDTPFTRKDLLTIQDPTDLTKFNFAEFHHLKLGLKVESGDSDPKTSELRAKNSETSSVMAMVDQTGAVS